MTHLTFSIADDVAEIVLDNPPQNRIDRVMTDELVHAIESIEAAGARAVILRSEGDNFSFGGDIVTWPDTELPRLRAEFESFMTAFNRLERMPIPVIAVVNGLCFGGGFELALRADLIFAGESAEFGHPEQTIGIVTLLGGIYRSAAAVGRNLAYEWALTSERVPAARMERHGLVNRVLPDDTVLNEARAFAARIAAGPTRAHAAHKALLRVWETQGVAAADTVMFDLAMPVFASEDAQRGIDSAVVAYRAGKPRPVMDFHNR
ncbi:MAG TPA: enoyl-CoA hydratase/isomerase family protein [Glaciibacter sp.]|nr:enoyl-CoA hydratase/isomerase family protein [Glaciibacter sp.]